MFQVCESLHAYSSQRFELYADTRQLFARRNNRNTLHFPRFNLLLDVPFRYRVLPYVYRRFRLNTTLPSLGKSYGIRR